MRLTRHTDYALRLLIHLAVSPDHRASAVEVSRSYGISVDHLRKVVQELTAAGIVETRRGRTGGVLLKSAPDAVSVGSVVRRLETDFQLVECHGPDNTCRITPACRLNGVLAEARDAFFAVLDGVTLADCVDDTTLARQLLGIPASA